MSENVRVILNTHDQSVSYLALVGTFKANTDVDGSKIKQDDLKAAWTTTKLSGSSTTRLILRLKVTAYAAGVDVKPVPSPTIADLSITLTNAMPTIVTVPDVVFVNDP